MKILIILFTLISSIIATRQNLDSLSETNKARKQVGVAPVSWDHKLAASAYAVSKSLSDAGCVLKHSGKSGVGENLYMTGRSSPFSFRDAVSLWYKERSSWRKGILNHFTQLVWKDTRKVGCAKSVNHHKNCEIVTCHYWPRVREELLFSGWVPKTFGEYFGFLVVAFLIALAYQALSNITFPKASILKPTLKDVYKKEMMIVRMASLKTITKFLEYLLILIVITGNVGYIFVILCGHFLGVLMFKAS